MTVEDLELFSLVSILVILPIDYSQLSKQNNGNDKENEREDISKGRPSQREREN